MSSTKDPVYQRAAKWREYEDFRKYAKPSFARRFFASAVDAFIFAIPSAAIWYYTGSYLSIIPFLVGFPFRDALLTGRSPGKALTGLVVVHPESFAPCTLHQSLARNTIYLLASPLVVLNIAVTLVVMVLSRRVLLNPLFVVGCDPDNGRTIADSWAVTHVLTPRDIVTMVKLRKEYDEIPLPASPAS